MVFAVLAHGFAPSITGRGLRRAERKYNIANDQVRDTCLANGASENGDEFHNLQGVDTMLKEEHSWRHKRASATGHQRKPFRAMAFLTSMASIWI